VHPEILDTFEAGWNALGTDMQQKWQAFGHKYNPRWRSWAHVAFEQIKDKLRQKKGAPIYYKNLLEFVHNEVADRITSKLPHSGSLFGLPDILGTRDIRGEIAEVVTEMVMWKEIGKFIQKLKEETDRDGLDALRKYLLEYN
jgi:hypothetical protein